MNNFHERFMNNSSNFRRGKDGSQIKTEQLKVMTLFTQIP